MNPASKDNPELSDNTVDPAQPVVMECPMCGHLLRLARKHLGIKGNCVSCSREIMGTESSPGKFEVVLVNSPESEVKPVLVETGVVNEVKEIKVTSDETPGPPSSELSFSSLRSSASPEPASSESNIPAPKKVELSQPTEFQTPPLPDDTTPAPENFGELLQTPPPSVVDAPVMEIGQLPPDAADVKSPEDTAVASLWGFSEAVSGENQMEPEAPSPSSLPPTRENVSDGKSKEIQFSPLEPKVETQTEPKVNDVRSDEGNAPFPGPFPVEEPSSLTFNQKPEEPNLSESPTRPPFLPGGSVGTAVLSSPSPFSAGSDPEKPFDAKEQTPGPFFSKEQVRQKTEARTSPFGPPPLKELPESEQPSVVGGLDPVVEPANNGVASPFDMPEEVEDNSPFVSENPSSEEAESQPVPFSAPESSPKSPLSPEPELPSEPSPEVKSPFEPENSEAEKEESPPVPFGSSENTTPATNQFTPEPEAPSELMTKIKTPFDLDESEDDEDSEDGEEPEDFLKDFLTGESEEESPDQDSSATPEEVFEMEPTSEGPQGPDPIDFSKIKLKSSVTRKRTMGTYHLLALLLVLSILVGFGAYVLTPQEERQRLRDQLAEWLEPGAIVIEKLPFGIGENLLPPKSASGVQGGNSSSVAQPVLTDSKTTASSAVSAP